MEDPISTFLIFFYKNTETKKIGSMYSECFYDVFIIIEYERYECALLANISKWALAINEWPLLFNILLSF